MMNIEFINTLLEIREHTLNSQGSYVEFITPYSMKIWDLKTSKLWVLPSGYIDILENYFPDDRQFVDWLNHKMKNIEFEKEIQRHLDLKSFI